MLPYVPKNKFEMTHKPQRRNTFIKHLDELRRKLLWTYVRQKFITLGRNVKKKINEKIRNCILTKFSMSPIRNSQSEKLKRWFRNTLTVYISD